MNTLTAIDLQKFLNDQDIAAQILHLDVDTPTVADAAVSLNVAPKQIIKSVLFLADKKPVMVIASGLARLTHRFPCAEIVSFALR